MMDKIERAQWAAEEAEGRFQDMMG